MLLEAALAALAGGCALAGWLAALLWRSPEERRAARRAADERTRLEAHLARAAEDLRIEFVGRRLEARARSGAELRAHVAEDESAELRRVLAALRGRAIFGTLDQVGAGALLTLIDGEKLTGVLVLVHGPEVGRLWCRSGQVVRARLEGHPLLSRGAEVVYHLLTWTDGRFEFTGGAVEGSDEIHLPTMHLLIEGARRMDEAGRAPTVAAGR